MKISATKVKTVLALTLLFTLFASTAIQASWFESRITLPRSGWWYTVQRESTMVTQRTRVTRNDYNVISNIARANDDNMLSSNQTHRSGQDDERDHRTDVVGANTCGAFRSSNVNIFTNQVTLAWQP